MTVSVVRGQAELLGSQPQSPTDCVLLHTLGAAAETPWAGAPAPPPDPAPGKSCSEDQRVPKSKPSLAPC